MRLASSGVGGVRRVRLALLYGGSCVGVLWMMFWMRLSSSGVWGGCIGHRCRPKASRTRRTRPTPDDASRMQYRHQTCATSPGPGPIVRWPTRNAARSAVLVGTGCVEVGGPWPHSPLADERLPLGSQSLLVVAALRSAGGLLRRGSGQLKEGLLVLGLAREQQCNTPVRTG